LRRGRPREPARFLVRGTDAVNDIRGKGIEVKRGTGGGKRGGPQGDTSYWFGLGQGRIRVGGEKLRLLKGIGGGEHEPTSERRDVIHRRGTITWANPKKGGPPFSCCMSLDQRGP